MSDLSNQTPADTYKGLLQVNDYTDGVDATAKYIQDGEGTDSALAISTGNVGIGTASPNAKLEIVDERIIGDIAKIEINPSSAGNPAGLHITNTNANFDEEAAYLKITDQAGSHKFRVQKNGNVGIGTTSPVRTLHIVDSTSDGSGGIKVQNYKPVIELLDANVNATATTLTQNQTKFTIANNSVDSLTIDSDGNVGIGTDSPESELHINGDITFSGETSQSQGTRAEIVHTSGVDANGLDAENDGGLLFKSYDNTSPVNALAITHDGKVGIGTTSPDGPLDITSTVSPTIFFNESSNTFQARIGVPSATGNVFSGSAMVGSLAIRNDTAIQLGATTPAVTIKDANVGIGTASPNNPLEVKSAGGKYGLHVLHPVTNDSLGGIFVETDNTTSLYLKDRSQTSPSTIRLRASGVSYFNGGNVGIGTTSPGAKLHVGSVAASNFDYLTIFDSTSNAKFRIGDEASLAINRVILSNNYKRTTTGYTADDTNYGVAHLAFLDGEIRFATAGAGNNFPTDRLTIDSVGDVTPGTDNAQDFGSATKRWNDIYATNTTIQTSDRELKQDIEELSEAETRVAQACKGLLRKYRWKSSVAEKGDDARIHFGIMAQDLEAAFAAEGLDAGRYGMFIKNTWWEADRVIPAVEAVEAVEAVYDEEGNEVSPAVEAVEAQPERTELDIFNSIEDAPEGATEVTQRGVRYAELLAFIIAAA